MGAEFTIPYAVAVRVAGILDSLEKSLEYDRGDPLAEKLRNDMADPAVKRWLDGVRVSSGIK